jgi:putative Ig domain-containing protein
MRFRLLHVLVLAAVAAAVFAGVAHALDFDDEDPEPPHAEVGMVYSYEIGTHAGCLPHRLVVAAGSLPPGLSIRRIDLDTHVVEGVATAAGQYVAWIHLLDCDNKSAETPFTFDVWARRWGIATAALKAAAVGSQYSATLEGAGLASDVTWEVTGGALPAGVTLSPAGVISGTPAATGSFTFTVKATAKEKNFGPTRIDSKEYTLNVLQPLSAMLSRSTAEAKVRFSTALVGTGGQAPYTWSATGVPAGLAVGPDGVLSGVPARSGSFTFTARVVDASGTVKETQVRLVVRQRLAIATKSLPTAAAGRAYRAKIASQGGVEGKRWTSGPLPRGLKLGATTGTITGVPASAGTFRITVRVRDALGAVSAKTLVLSVR